MLKRILVRCPSTAKLTPTGQTVEEDAWGDTKLAATKVSCPHCSGSHPLKKADVVLAR